MFYSFYSVINSLCLPIVLLLVYGTCVYFTYNKVITHGQLRLCAAVHSTTKNL